MPIDTSSILAYAEELTRRMTPEARAAARRSRERRRKRALVVFRRIVLATVAILFAAAAFGLLVTPLGLEGLMATVAAVVLSWVLIAGLSRGGNPEPEALATTDLPLIPQHTEAWLEQQRPALPAPAVRLLDGIGVRLEALAPQLAGLNPAEPAAAEVRKLLCDDLPELVRGYKRVPEPLRRQPGLGGVTPDTQLTDGLRLVDSEIARMTGQLASGDLQRLATQGRYLELKYRGDEPTG